MERHTRKEFTGGRVGQSTKFALSILFVYSLGSPVNSLTQISILLMWPHVFLLLSPRNSGTGVEFWGQRIHIFLKTDLTKLPSKKVIILFISVSNV